MNKIIFIVGITAVIIGFYAIYDFFNNPCDLVLEQSVACIKGCQHYDAFVDGIEDSKYDPCIKKCSEHYKVIFDRNGGIDKCFYWNNEVADKKW